MQQTPTAQGPAVTRRSFLASGLRAGAGVAGLGLGLGACSSGSRPHDSAPDAAAAHPEQKPIPESVHHEPPAPPPHSRYVSRPDLTPVGVSVATAPSFAGAGLTGSYIFCAPKSPLAANPGPLPPGHHAFPPGATHGLMILDTSGELVWFKPLARQDEIPFNFRVQTYRGKPTLTWFQGTVADGHAIGGHYVLADDTYARVAEVHATRTPCDLHEFLLTPEGTALHTSYEPGVRSAAGTPLVVGHAQEVDVATNDLLFDWPCYPAVSPDLSYTGHDADYFHINSIDLWPGPERNLLVCSRNTSAVYLVDRRTKQVVWRVGGKQSHFALGAGVPFYYQHDARPLADGSGISVFDDASHPCPEKAASGKVLTLDQHARTATLVHRYLHTDREVVTPSQGNCQLLANGAHMVGWGYLPIFSAYAPAPHTVEAPLVLDGRFPEGAASYRTFLFEWIGRPSARELRLVVRPAAGSGQFSAWMSWNGATEVAHWQVRAGATPAALATVTVAARTGFETAVSFTSDGARSFEVVALDRSGATLGRSDLVAATTAG
jgi:hypothetical protein